MPWNDMAGLDPREALSRPWPAGNAAVPCRSLLPTVRGEAVSADWHRRRFVRFSVGKRDGWGRVPAYGTRSIGF